MSEILIVLGVTFVLIVGTGMFATHMTMCRDYKYYKPVYKLLNQLNDGTKISMIGNGYMVIKIEGHSEIIFFQDGAIKLAYDTYIHNAFFTYFSPYALYYRRKFNKVKPHLTYLYHRARRDVEEETSFEIYFRNLQSTKSKEISFKFFRG